MFAASQSALFLNSVRFPMGRACSYSPSPDGVLSLPGAISYQLCKKGHCLDSSAVTSKCYVSAVEQEGRRWRR